MLKAIKEGKGDPPDKFAETVFIIYGLTGFAWKLAIENINGAELT